MERITLTISTEMNVGSKLENSLDTNSIQDLSLRESEDLTPPLNYLDYDYTEGWVGIDLDGTLAAWGKSWDGWSIHEPIAKMVEKIHWLVENEIPWKIFTARVGHGDNSWNQGQRQLIQYWCQEHLGCVPEVTATKDHYMVVLWDDRAWNVVMDTGVFQDAPLNWRGLVLQRFGRASA